MNVDQDCVMTVGDKPLRDEATFDAFNPATGAGFAASNIWQPTPSMWRDKARRVGTARSAQS